MSTVSLPSRQPILIKHLRATAHLLNNQLAAGLEAEPRTKFIVSYSERLSESVIELKRQDFGGPRRA